MASTAVFGIYSNRDQAEAALEQMQQEGLRRADISMLFPRKDGNEDFGVELDNRGLEGSSVGAACGALVGGALGWLLGIGALAITGLDPYIGHGPIISLLSGAVVFATLGGLAGGLTGMGISAYQTACYKGRIKGGIILLLVHCDNPEWTRRARNVLERTGSKDIVGASEFDDDYARTHRAGTHAEQTAE